MSLEEAIDSFESLYSEKSGNSWHNRHHFVKVPGRMFPMEVDYGSVSAYEIKISDSLMIIFYVTNISVNILG